MYNLTGVLIQVRLQNYGLFINKYTIKATVTWWKQHKKRNIEQMPKKSLKAHVYADGQRHIGRLYRAWGEGN